MCVCVCEREREREREGGKGRPRCQQLCHLLLFIHLRCSRRYIIIVVVIVTDNGVRMIMRGNNATWAKNVFNFVRMMEYLPRII